MYNERSTTFTCPVCANLQFSFSGLSSNNGPRPAGHCSLSSILHIRGQDHLQFL